MEMKSLNEDDGIYVDDYGTISLQKHRKSIVPSSINEDRIKILSDDQLQVFVYLILHPHS